MDKTIVVLKTDTIVPGNNSVTKFKSAPTANSITANTTNVTEYMKCGQMDKMHFNASFSQSINADYSAGGMSVPEVVGTGVTIENGKLSLPNAYGGLRFDGYANAGFTTACHIRFKWQPKYDYKPSTSYNILFTIGSLESAAGRITLFYVPSSTQGILQFEYTNPDDRTWVIIRPAITAFRPDSNTTYIFDIFFNSGYQTTTTVSINGLTYSATLGVPTSTRQMSPYLWIGSSPLRPTLFGNCYISEFQIFNYAYENDSSSLLSGIAKIYSTFSCHLSSIMGYRLNVAKDLTVQNNLTMTNKGTLISTFPLQTTYKVPKIINGSSQADTWWCICDSSSPFILEGTNVFTVYNVPSTGAGSILEFSFFNASGSLYLTDANGRVIYHRWISYNAACPIRMLLRGYSMSGSSGFFRIYVSSPVAELRCDTSCVVNKKAFYFPGFNCGPTSSMPTDVTSPPVTLTYDTTVNLVNNYMRCGKIQVDSLTPSTSKTTGAVICPGGCGLAGNLNIGTALYVNFEGTFTATWATNPFPVGTTMVFTYRIVGNWVLVSAPAQTYTTTNILNNTVNSTAAVLPAGKRPNVTQYGKWFINYNNIQRMAFIGFKSTGFVGLYETQVKAVADTPSWPVTTATMTSLPFAFVYPITI